MVLDSNIADVSEAANDIVDKDHSISSVQRLLRWHANIE
jgi:hypothetical protein